MTKHVTKNCNHLLKVDYMKCRRMWVR